MPITQFTDIPGRGQDPTTFAARADNFMGVQLPRFVTEANILAAEVEEDASTAASAAALAATVTEAAAGLVDFKGDWSALSGPLAPPASVRHGGRLWVLTSATPSVQLSEPGVDVARWEPVNRTMLVATVSVLAFSGDNIIAPGSANINVTLPAGPSAGDFVAVTRAGTGTVTVLRNGSTIAGVAEDAVVDLTGTRFSFIYAAGTWRIVMEGVVA